MSRCSRHSSRTREGSWAPYFSIAAQSSTVDSSKLVNVAFFLIGPPSAMRSWAVLGRSATRVMGWTPGVRVNAHHETSRDCLSTRFSKPSCVPHDRSWKCSRRLAFCVLLTEPGGRLRVDGCELQAIRAGCVLRIAGFLLDYWQCCWFPSVGPRMTRTGCKSRMACRAIFRSAVSTMSPGCSYGYLQSTKTLLALDNAVLDPRPLRLFRKHARNLGHVCFNSFARVLFQALEQE